LILAVSRSLPIIILVVSNMALQIFDGVATYVGWSRFGEANPLLQTAFAMWGPGPTLMVAKGAAVALILMLSRAGRPLLVGAGLSFTMAAYVSLSLVPWTLRLWP
jgi:hypothetical protein